MIMSVPQIPLSSQGLSENITHTCTPVPPEEFTVLPVFQYFH